MHILLLVLLVALAYLQVTENGFMTGFDDGVYVTGNAHVRAGLTLDGLRWAFTTNHAANWHPVTWVSHMLDWQLYGSNPSGHHFTSLLLHAANTLLLFLLLCSMTGQARRSLFVAALFAVHPLHVESVAWIAERKDVLSTFFGLLTIAAYLRYVRVPRARRYLLALAAYVLSLLSKPMLVSLPFVLLLLDYWPLRRREAPRSLLLEKVPLIALALASCLVTLWAQHSGGTVISTAGIAVGVRAANAAVSCVDYIAKMLYPLRLAAFYPHPSTTLPAWQVVGSVALVCAGFASALACAKRKPYVTVGWLWYVITLLPVVGLVQVGAQAMADRYTYVPLIGLFIALTWLAADAYAAMASRDGSSWRAAVPAVVGSAIVISLALHTFAEVRYWRNNETLFTRAIEVTRNNALAHYNLALDLQNRGRSADAARHYLAALRIDPKMARAHLNLGTVLLKEGCFEEAYEAFDAALELQPGSAGAYQGIAAALAGQGRAAESAECYREVTRIEPNNDLAHYNLGNALFRLGRLDEAAEEYHQAVRFNPSLVGAHHNLGVVFQHRGQNALALKEYRETVRLSPDDPKEHDALAVVLCSLGDYAGAWEQVRETVRCGGEPDAGLMAVLREHPL